MQDQRWRSSMTEPSEAAKLDDLPHEVVWGGLHLISLFLLLSHSPLLVCCSKDGRSQTHDPQNQRALLRCQLLVANRRSADPAVWPLTYSCRAAEATQPPPKASTRASTDLLYGQMGSVPYRSPGERKGRDLWRGLRYDAEDSGAHRNRRPLRHCCIDLGIDKKTSIWTLTQQQDHGRTSLIIAMLANDTHPITSPEPNRKPAGEACGDERSSSGFSVPGRQAMPPLMKRDLRRRRPTDRSRLHNKPTSNKLPQFFSVQQTSFLFWPLASGFSIKRSDRLASSFEDSPSLDGNCVVLIRLSLNRQARIMLRHTAKGH
ncbi:hypothetical protein B0I37DRAFT_188959 [Chaetomium sp. MPI-CAGE-AT-0009]|nr:hypothetical protein B0I37DRAFT_188959 [Chaetomium sp. MPI-CAGE-AT-0009]